MDTRYCPTNHDVLEGRERRDNNIMILLIYNNLYLAVTYTLAIPLPSDTIAGRQKINNIKLSVCRFSCRICRGVRLVCQQYQYLVLRR